MVTKFDASNMPTKVAAEIKDFDPTKYIDKKEAKRMDPYCQYAMAASKMAVEMSGLTLTRWIKINLESLLVRNRRNNDI